MSEDDLTGSEGEDHDEPTEDDPGDGDEEEWQKFQQDFKKENQLESKSKKTFEVHCPYIPVVSTEFGEEFVAGGKRN